MQIIVKDEVHNRTRLKGKTVTDFAKNLQSEGWPPETDVEEHDRIKYAERRNRYSLKTEDAVQIKKEMGVDLEKNINKLGKEKGYTLYKKGYPNVKGG